MNRDSYELKGLATAGTATFVSETRGNPLEAFSSLCIRGRPFNLWLTAEYLEPQLERWSGGKRNRIELAETVAVDVEETTRRACMAFHEIANSVPAPSDQGLLAATGVTANLQRTLALIGEFMLGDPIGKAAMFPLSRFWCGLINYSQCPSYFSMCVEETTAPGPLRADRREYSHIRNALRCSVREIEPRCTDGCESSESTSDEADCSDPMTRHLLSSSIPRREATEPYRNRSGVVRPKNSSM